MASITAGLALHHDYITLHLWAGLVALICFAPMAQVAASRLAESVPALLVRIHPLLGSRRIGQVLVQQHMITITQLRQLLDLQATVDAPWMRLGDLAVAQGLITRSDLAAALLVATPWRIGQRRSPQPIQAG